MTSQPQLVPEPAAVSALERVTDRFRLRAQSRTAWLRRLWAAEGEPGGRIAVTHAEIDSILSGSDSPKAQEEWVSGQAWGPRWAEELRTTEEALTADADSRLAHFRHIFGLSPQESDLFEACLAVAVDTSLARLCAYLQDNVGREYMTAELAALLYSLPSCGVWTGESSLCRWQLIVERDVGVGEPPALACDPEIRDWLAGVAAIPEALAGLAHLVEPRTPPASWPLNDVVANIRHHVHQEVLERVRVTLCGARGSGRRTFAAAVAAELGLPLLVIDCDQIEESQWRHAHLRAQRHAYLQRSALLWCGDAAVRRSWPSVVPPFPIQFIIAETGQEPHPCAAVVELRVRMPALNADERSRLWRHYLPASRLWPEDEFRSLAERYRVQVGDITAVAQSGAASAREAGLRVREAARGRLGNLAQLLQCPFVWDDLVVSPNVRAALEDIVFEANHRGSFWEQSEPRRLFPQGQGLMALFSGPPGTGKTMAAQVMAAALGYDLFRVDLAGVVSKWVGETSQNFERILTRAADMHAMILFDECDAIFAKRTSEIRDAQDKFANTDAAYLLQAIESYPGIALLATNQKGNVDPAFIRRLRYVLEFSKPDAAQRLEIWRKIVRGLAGEDRLPALSAALELLSEAIEATGAQIKYAVLGALFGAKREEAPLDLRHLLRGLERELAKEGRMLSARDRERILNHAR